MKNETEEDVRMRRRREAFHLQAMEGNPMTDEDMAMFDMFDRKGWSAEQRREYIIEQALQRNRVNAAE